MAVKVSKGKARIHIKESRKGSLRKAMGAKKGAKLSESEMRSRLAAAKKSGNTAMVKKLVFALNARKWKKG
jgi:hypothetical protein